MADVRDDHSAFFLVDFVYHSVRPLPHSVGAAPARQRFTSRWPRLGSKPENSLDNKSADLYRQGFDLLLNSFRDQESIFPSPRVNGFAGCLHSGWTPSAG